jgi:hypothetical protein
MAIITAPANLVSIFKFKDDSGKEVYSAWPVVAINTENGEIHSIDGEGVIDIDTSDIHERIRFVKDVTEVMFKTFNTFEEIE